MWVETCCCRHILAATRVLPVAIRRRINNQTLSVLYLGLCEFCALLLFSERDRVQKSKRSKTLNSGYLGSRNDEERSEMRYVM